MFPLRDLNRSRTTPIVTYALLAANVAVFVYQLGLSPHAAQIFVYRYAVIPRLLTDDLHLASLVTPVTSMFVHGGLAHVVSNMWFLHIFGDNVEDAMGRVRYLMLYFGSGVLAAGAQVFVDPGSAVPMVGASGAIAGVLAAYIRFYPHARVVTINPLVMALPLLMLFVPWTFELPAIFFVVVWFAFQLLSGIGTLGLPSQGGVAFFAHIGGFLAGLWLTVALGARRNATSGFRARQRFDQR